MRNRRWTRGDGRWLLLVPALVLVSGCGAGSSGKSGAAGANGLIGGPSWISVVTGSPTPSASSGGRPSPSPSTIGGYLPLPRVAPATTTNPQPVCTDANWHAGQINGLTAVPGPGTASVSWRDSGAANVIGYRVTATSQHLLNGRQRDTGATMVSSTGYCSQLSATLTGLDRRTPYTVTLEVIYRHQNTDSSRITTVGRSTVVTTT